MYEQGEVLVYGNNGVCRVEEIRRERFSGKPAMYYILHPLFDSRSKVYVPVENEKLASKLRPVMNRDMLKGMVRAARESTALWESDDRRRKESFHDVISNGLSAELLTVMKLLLLRKTELAQSVRRLHSADEKLLAQCEKIVGEEFAYAFGVDIDDALSHVTQELTAA